ncbi:hypothetical protein BJ878DRAFT_21224 [Calycina marina]|uniref:Nicotinamide-nucleotide adenylyltransferase n=1 Tax=Calycina marina TaxID=1763456 RepID=A0A9P8CG62_9HELO|nr:hypothetical protein BJ878DRAFT_21224 [Calycina marina]
MAANAAPQTAVMQSSTNYSFPQHRLRRTQNDPIKTPLVLVACGSFSPITYLHLRMFEMAADFAKFNTNFEILGGFLSPVGDAYKKAGLATAQHRLRMCELATDLTSTWLSVDPWEAMQSEYIPTAQVLDHFQYEINEVLGGVKNPDGTNKPIKVMLLAGADLIQTMSTPDVWSDEDLDHILGGFGTFIVERTGTDIDDAVSNLQKYKDNIYVIQQLIHNDVSSTKIRLFLRREMSIQYLIPAPVIEYINLHGLYGDDGASSMNSMRGKEVTSGSASLAVGASGSKS